ncbi:MAG: DUF4827 domain-containing protein [Prevotella sp.]|jgi:hypothetical protein
MKKLVYLLLLLTGIIAFQACNDEETYADKKKKQRAAINKYIADSAVTVLSEEEFYAQDSTTDVSKNEWVLFNSSGVYMQIVRKGCGSKITDGETATVLVRFTERNMLTDSITLSNNNLYYGLLPEKMRITCTSGTYSGSFVSGSSLMATVYSSTAVPTGWLVPFAYVNVGRPVLESDEIAKVRLIVPAEKGQQAASQTTTPYLYDLTFERGR